jgi:CheY-like chemotaxis protein
MPRILVIDDQPDVRTMISIVLRIHHFEVVEAASGDAGLKEFENSRFDLAIVDIFLQGTNGFDVITMMRERVPDLPIVAISGMTTLDFVSGTRTFQRHLPAEAVSSQRPRAGHRSGLRAVSATGHRSLLANSGASRGRRKNSRPAATLSIATG